VRASALVLAAVALAGCGGSSQPKDDPAKFAVSVVNQIVHNRYSQVWSDLHPKDQQVAPFGEYVQCETRNPVISAPRSVKVKSVVEESVGLGDGTFVKSKAVDVRLGFAGGFNVTHTVHVVASHGKWTYILPSWRFRDYRADKCPSDPGSCPPPTSA
jgi:hypothetical protein